MLSSGAARLKSHAGSHRQPPIFSASTPKNAAIPCHARCGWSPPARALHSLSQMVGTCSTLPPTEEHGHRLAQGAARNLQPNGQQPCRWCATADYCSSCCTSFSGPSPSLRSPPSSSTGSSSGASPASSCAAGSPAAGSPAAASNLRAGRAIQHQPQAQLPPPHHVAPQQDSKLRSCLPSFRPAHAVVSDRPVQTNQQRCSLRGASPMHPLTWPALLPPQA